LDERRTIQERRESLGWTKKHFARKAGISRPSVYVLERGEERDVKLRIKAEAALDREEEERRQVAVGFGMDAYNATARAVGDLEEMLDRGAITPGGALLSLRSILDAYATRIEEIDPVAVEEAVKYTSALVKARMNTRAERN
jgi:transcriptional regulator with XRE-family HTH domain